MPRGDLCLVQQSAVQAMLATAAKRSSFEDQQGEKPQHLHSYAAWPRAHQSLALSQGVQRLICLPCRLKQLAQLQQAAHVGRCQAPPAWPCRVDWPSPSGIAAPVEQHRQQTVPLCSVEECWHHVARGGARLGRLPMQRCPLHR